MRSLTVGCDGCVQHHHLVIREAIRARSALTMLVHHKALKLSSQTKSEIGTGRILTLATIDANRILDLFYYGASMHPLVVETAFDW